MILAAQPIREPDIWKDFEVAVCVAAFVVDVLFRYHVRHVCLFDPDADLQ